MQSFLVLSPDNLYEHDLINSLPLSSRTSNGLYTVVSNTKLKSKCDYTVVSAHDPSVFLHKKSANILISIVSYVPTMEYDSWANFYTNICLSDVLVIDRYNLEQLNTYAYPKKRIILLDGVDIATKPRITKKDDEIGVYCVDPVNRRLWDRFVEYNTSLKEPPFKVVTDVKEVDIAISMYPLGYGLTYQFVNKFPFFVTAFHEETSTILDARSIHHLDKRLGAIIDVKGSAYTPQIKEELKIFSETLVTLVGHLQTTKNELFRYKTNQSLMDRIFHQLNSTYKSK